MKKERYFICPNCAQLTTWSDILSEIENSGSVGMCYCQFTNVFWSEKFDDLDVTTDRIFVEYVEISKKWYEYLKNERNDVLRLKAFQTIPKNKLM